MCLRDRNYDLAAQLRQIRATATAAQRATMVNALGQMALTDQAGVNTVVTNAGGIVVRNFWVSSALCVEIAPALVPTLRLHPRVRAMVPIEARVIGDAVATAVEIGDSGAVPLPITASTGPLNHNLQAAWSILGSKGAGAVVAFFDTGIDADANGQTGLGNPDHQSFWAPWPSTQTRILAHLRADPSPGVTVDCNNISAYGSWFNSGPPIAFRPCYHNNSAGHGTAMAGIAVGRAAYGLGDGHAPEAAIVDVSLTRVSASGVKYPWILDTADYLAAAEALRSFILSTQTKVHVLNISQHGFPDPFHPVSVCLDELAREEDILLVTCAGNVPDESRMSNGFWHGLAVGAVHARSEGNLAFVPLSQQTRGPLNSNFDRFYPDVCATGAGASHYYPAFQDTNGYMNLGTTEPAVQASMMQMPVLDPADWTSIGGYAYANCGTGPVPPGMPIQPGTIRFNCGTSEAAAQVSGAAALYRGARPTATAEETRAALLLNVIGTFTDATGNPPAVFADQDTYHGRNTFGVGYVRDDLLAEFAMRSGIHALHEVLQPDGADADVTYGGLTVGRRYAVAMCWRRYDGIEGESQTELELPNLDLEVRSAPSGASLIARSATLANSYERLVFQATSTSVLLRVKVVQAQHPEQAITVHLVARELPVDLDPPTSDLGDAVQAVTGMVETLDAGSGCTGTPARDLTVGRIVPAAYSDAYGSAAFVLQPVNAYSPPSQSIKYWVHPGYAGLDLTAYSELHVVVARGEMGGAMNLGGIALRSWRPMSISSPVTVQRIDVVELPGTGNPTLQDFQILNDHNVTTQVAQSITLPALASSVALRPDRFDLLLPFTTAPYQYNGSGKLHIWITFAPNQGPLEVDGVDDGPGCGYSMGQYLGGPTTLFLEGKCPILGLIPAVFNPTAQQPSLRLRGEPWIGQSLEAHLTQAPAMSRPLLALGLWQPFAVPGTCNLHVGQATLFTALTDTQSSLELSGFFHWQVPIPNNPSLVHSVWGLQAVYLTGPFSNALRVTIGGGL